MTYQRAIAAYFRAPPTARACPLVLLVRICGTDTYLASTAVQLVLCCTSPYVKARDCKKPFVAFFFLRQQEKCSTISLRRITSGGAALLRLGLLLPVVPCRVPFALSYIRLSLYSRWARLKVTRNKEETRDGKEADKRRRRSHSKG